MTITHNLRTYRISTASSTTLLPDGVTCVTIPLSYVVNMVGVTGLLAGPALEYNDYIRAMDGSIYLQVTDC